MQMWLFGVYTGLQFIAYCCKLQGPNRPHLEFFGGLVFLSFILTLTLVVDLFRDDIHYYGVKISTRNPQPRAEVTKLG